MGPLITVDDLAGYMQRPIDRFSATVCVTGASGLVRAYCGWNLSRITETLTVDANGSGSVNLPTLRLNDVTEVRVAGAVLDGSQYGWATNGVLAFTARSAWPSGLQCIAVDADHGYDPIPDEIGIVVAAIAGRLYGNPEGLMQKSSGDDSRSYGPRLSDLEMRLISAHCLT
jgi:hypothetical protein